MVTETMVLSVGFDFAVARAQGRGFKLIHLHRRFVDKQFGLRIEVALTWVGYSVARRCIVSQKNIYGF